MRRVLGLILTGIAILALVLAVLLPAFVVPRVKKTPLDLDITIRSTGAAKVFNAVTGKVEDRNLRATRVVRTDSKASDSKNTVVDESLCTVIVAGDTPDCVPSSDRRLLAVTTDRVATDRKSGAAVDDKKYSAGVNGDTSVKHEGMAYKWPIDAKKQTYKFFLPDLKKAFDAKFVGTERIQGLTLYKSVCDTGEQAYLINGAFPGKYEDARTVWVEPKTGVIVKGVEHQVQTLDSGQLALDTTFTFDERSQKSQADYAKNKIRNLNLARVWAPVGLGVIGIASLVGAALLLRGRRGPGAHAETGEPQPVGPAPGRGLPAG